MISCIIGLLDFEREHEQTIIVNLQADYEYENSFVNYAEIVNLIETHLKQEKYELLESAIEGLKNVIFKQFGSLKRLTIKINKPDIINNCSVGLSGHWTNIPR
jgi:dihydroneopterin aldolase